MLREIVWCEHVRLVPSPMVLSKTAHCYIPAQQIYLVVEDAKVKVICPHCWRIGTQPRDLFAKES